MAEANDNNILKNSTIMKSSKIVFKDIMLLEKKNDNFKSTYYLSLIINNLQPQNTKNIEFTNNCECKLNQIMSLDNGEPKKKYIKIELYQKDKKIFSNLVLKGEIFNENFIHDNISDNFICYLYNNEGVEKAIVHYKVDYASGSNNNEVYNKNVKRIEKIYKRSMTNESNIYNLFLINLQYVKLVASDINYVLNWKDKWRTLSYLFAFTFIVIFFKIFYVFIFPLYLIFLHIKNKNNIEKFIITRDNITINNNNKKKNKIILYQIMHLYNKIIKIYENIMFKIVNGKKIMIELYTRIGIAIVANICFFHFKMYNLINFKSIILIIVWFYVLRRNPSFHSFSLFIYNIIQERTLFITSNQHYFTYKTNFINLITLLNPFYSLYRLYIEEYIDSSLFFRKKKENDNFDYIKYEIYENERWWLFVGWNKDLVFDEPPIWYKIDKPKEYCDKIMVKLPGGENKYRWDSDWKIEINPNCDENGWEYSADFNKKFGSKSGKDKVRRRKWIRFAIKN